MYLFFDTSANGSPKNWKAPSNDAFNWPRMLHLSWLLYNEDRELIKSRNDIIKTTANIPIEIENRHKISPAISEDEGISIKEALLPFKEVVKDAQYIISHNLTFNKGVVGAEFYRAGIDHALEYSNNYCLMQEATWFCKLKGKGGRMKWPSLNDIHIKLYKAGFENPGHAEADVAVTALAFFNLLDIQAIEIFE